MASLPNFAHAETVDNSAMGKYIDIPKCLENAFRRDLNRSECHSAEVVTVERPRDHWYFDIRQSGDGLQFEGSWERFRKFHKIRVGDLLCWYYDGIDDGVLKFRLKIKHRNNQGSSNVHAAPAPVSFDVTIFRQTGPTSNAAPNPPIIILSDEEGGDATSDEDAPDDTSTEGEDEGGETDEDEVDSCTMTVPPHAKTNLNIPRHFFEAHINDTNTPVQLVGDVVSSYVTLTENGKSARFGGGWAGFKKANNLNPGCTYSVAVIGPLRFRISKITG